MTLSTNVYVLDPVDVHELFRFCQELLTQYDEGRHLPPERQVMSDGPGSVYRNGGFIDDPDGRRRIANQLGQNLPAILDIDYRVGGPLREAQTECDDDCNPDECSGRYHERACYADVDFDTAYGARFSFGGCSELHALLVSDLGQWLDAKGIRWEWRNEYTGDVHGGDERYTALAGLLDSGDKAMDWFRNCVLPAVPAMVADVMRKDES